MVDRGPGDADEPILATTDRPTVSRRAPFSSNPVVGARGMKTQQRILDAALTAFGDSGYTGTTVDRIAQSAGCSRVSFYQYFVDKDDVFRHLAGTLARQLAASLEALDPITPEQDGWTAVRTWVARRGDIQARYEPVFRAFGAAADSNPELAAASAQIGAQHAALFDSKVAQTTLAQRQLDPVVALLLGTLGRTFEIGTILRSALPNDYTRERLEDALTDVIHRTLFGIRPGINDRPTTLQAAPILALSEGLPALFAEVARLEAEAPLPGRRTLEVLLEVGRSVVVSRGYQSTRVDDLVTAAGISHGAFYRYFPNKHDFVRVLAARSLLAVSTAFGEIPRLDRGDPVARRAAMRRWLRRFQELNGEHGAMVRVWVEAGRPDEVFRTDSASVYDWGRRQMLRWLGARTNGDVTAEAVVALAAVETFGSRDADPVELDAIVHILESILAINGQGG